MFEGSHRDMLDVKYGPTCDASDVATTSPDLPLWGFGVSAFSIKQVDSYPNKVQSGSFYGYRVLLEIFSRQIERQPV